jgi:Lytic transglycolase/Putative peptidoglycan binding domain
MHDPAPRRAAATDNRDRAHRRHARPSLIVALAAAALLGIGAGVAHASGGGVSASGATGGAAGTQTGSVTPGCPNKQLGRRTLKLGDCGGDVATLNWILRAKDYAAAPLADRFRDPTQVAVESFQRDADLTPSGVVDGDTSAALVNAMPPQRATWYGPGFFGDETACGQVLRRTTMGVAHKRLPCGSKVVLRYRGRFVRTTVIDRGPFANGARWDLTQATAQALRFEYTDDVRVAKLGRVAK